MLNKDELFEYAYENFPDSIARVINDQINEDYNNQIQSAPMTPLGVSTLFLGDMFYKKLSIGSFENKINLAWEGDNKFSLRQNEPNVFSFTTSNDIKIIPKSFITDGGSIPWIFQFLSSFDPWHYAPAYIIHDWLFKIHRCQLVDPVQFDFEDCALVLAEAMKTLMVKGYQNSNGQTVIIKKDEDALYIIYQGVKTIIAKAIWNQKNQGNC